MHEDRLTGMGKQISGSIKDAISMVNGDTKTQAEGTTAKAAYKAQSAVGGIKGPARHGLKG